MDKKLESQKMWHKKSLHGIKDKNTWLDHTSIHVHLSLKSNVKHQIMPNTIGSKAIGNLKMHEVMLQLLHILE